MPACLRVCACLPACLPACWRVVVLLHPAGPWEHVIVGAAGFYFGAKIGAWNLATYEVMQYEKSRCVGVGVGVWVCGCVGVCVCK